MAAAAAAGGGSPAKTAELLRIIPDEIRASVANELHLPDAFHRMKRLIKEGADPSGGPHGSTLEVILKATSNYRGHFREIGQNFMELLLKNGADPNHTYTIGKYRKRPPYMYIISYDNEWTGDDNAAILISWFDLLGKYGFNFKQPNLVLSIIGEIADSPADAVNRTSKVLSYFAGHGAPMNGVEEFINGDFGLWSGINNNASKQKIKNALRRNTFMRMNTLRPGLKAKISSYAFQKGGKTRRKRRLRK